MTEAWYLEFFLDLLVIVIYCGWCGCVADANVCRTDLSSKKPQLVTSKPSAGAAINTSIGRSSAAGSHSGALSASSRADDTHSVRAAASERPHNVPDRPPTSNSASERSHATNVRDRRQLDRAPADTARPQSATSSTVHSDRPASVPPPLPEKPSVLDKPSLSTDKTSRDSSTLNCGQTASTDRLNRDRGLGRQRTDSNTEHHHQQQAGRGVAVGSSENVKRTKPSVPPPTARRPSDCTHPPYT